MTKRALIHVAYVVMTALLTVSCNRKVEFGKSPVNKVVAAMTSDEKRELIMSVIDAGQTYPIPRLGIPSVRIAQIPEKLIDAPLAVMLAQSWNLQLVEQTGAAVGDEIKRGGADCVLTPDLRYADPVITGKTVAALALGIQSLGIGAAIRYNTYDLLSSRLRLKDLEISVRESQPWAVKVSGASIPDDSILIDSIIRREWGFDGMVMAGLSSMHGSVDEMVIDRNVTDILSFISRSSQSRSKDQQDDADTESVAGNVSRDIVTEGMVLLKNNGTLPLGKNCNMIALYGVSSYDMYVTAFKSAGFKLEPSVSAAYGRSAVNEYNVPQRRPFQYRADAIASDIAVITIGRDYVAPDKRSNDNGFLLSDAEKELLNDVCDAFHSKGKKVVVILNTCHPVETSSWKMRPDAILLAGVPGPKSGYVVTDALKGVVNPSGKLVDTYVAAYAGTSGRQTDHVSYPFGYGLSYTSFEYSNPQAQIEDGIVNLSVNITNTGSVAGREVVQVYIEMPTVRSSNIIRELKAYGKTALLQPGESQTIEFRLSEYELAGFNAAMSCWQTVQGEYNVSFAASSQDIRSKASFTVSNACTYPVFGKF